MEATLGDYSSEDDRNTAPIVLSTISSVVLTQLVVASIVGLATNSALLFVLRKTNVLTAPYAFIFNLAAADLLAVFCYLPVATAALTGTPYPFPGFVCEMSRSLFDVTLGVTVFSLIALSAHSYLDRKSTTATSQGKRTKSMTVAAVVVIWTLAVVLAVPTMVYEENPRYLHEHPASFCLPIEPDFQLATFFIRTVVFYAIPLAVFGVFFCISNRNGMTNIQRDVFHLTLALVIVYAVCFFLINFFGILSMFPIHDDGYFFGVVSSVGYCLVIAYRCLTPVALYCVSVTFRELFNRHVFCCFLGNREPVLENREPVPDSELPLKNV